MIKIFQRAPTNVSVIQAFLEMESLAQISTNANSQMLAQPMLLALIRRVISHVPVTRDT